MTNIREWLPSLRWYHYLIVLYLGLPLRASEPVDPAYVLGQFLGSLALVWTAVFVYRRVASTVANSQGSPQTDA